MDAVSVVAATETSISAAEHLLPMDDGALAVLRRMARQIDAQTEGGLTPDGKLDNVSIPTYLKFCESLGLTPAGRKRLDEKKEPGGGSKLAQLRSVQTGTSRTARRNSSA